jgi:serine/threonine protein kinase
MAVRKLRPDGLNDFANERDVLSRIRNSRTGHVNVLVNYGSLIYGEHRMLLLPWTDLGTLDDFIKDESHRDTTAKKRNVIYCIIDVADALAWLTNLKISLPQKFREVQVTHCDIKPQNILIFPDSSREDGFIFKVSDFGHAFVSSPIETQSRRY